MADARDTLNKLAFHCGLPGKDPAAELSKYIQELQAAHKRAVDWSDMYEKKYFDASKACVDIERRLSETLLQLVDARRVKDTAMQLYRAVYKATRDASSLSGGEQ